VIEDVIEMRAAPSVESVLREDLRRYQHMFEQASIGHLTMEIPGFRITAVNQVLCTLMGYTREELLGANGDELFRHGGPWDRTPTDRLLAGEIDSYVVEREFPCKDGHLVPVLDTVCAVRGEDGRVRQLLVLIQGLSSQRAAELARRDSQMVLETAIASSQVSVTTFDRDLRFTFLAGGGITMANRRPSDFLGRDMREVSDDPDTIAALEAALGGQQSSRRTEYRGRTYSTVHAPLRGDGAEITGVISVSTDVTERVRADEEALFAARHDALTGLPMRAALVEHLDALLGPRAQPCTVLLIGLDDLQAVRHSLGHEVGDAVLRGFAAGLTSAFPADMVALPGADNFAVVIPGVSAEGAVERVHRALTPLARGGEHSVTMTASVGVALARAGGSPAAVLRDADSALYEAKRQGPGECRVYDPASRRIVQQRLDTESGLRHALQAGCLRLEYQPIVSLVDRRILGAEALLRWDDPVRGTVSPHEFIPVAEATGLIVPIGVWVMHRACQDVTHLYSQHDLQVSVNVSVRQLISGDFSTWLRSVLRDTGLPAAALTVEVTESALSDDLGSVRDAFERLRSDGVRIAVDDFGTGFSSLARLQNLPVDIIKLDRAFVIDVAERPEARTMAAAIYELSKAIGATIVAEGIETEAQADTLLQIGYEQAQGFLFARPMPLTRLHDLLRR
jgi:diguanylate cyclase (GGDEF)-like protein/PAS domain S-box-containing protein